MEGHKPMVKKPTNKSKTTKRIRLYASQAETWQNCPGSLDFDGGVNYLKSQFDAEKGTEFHLLMEKIVGKLKEVKNISKLPTFSDIITPYKSKLELETIERLEICYNKVKADLVDLIEDEGKNFSLLSGVKIEEKFEINLNSEFTIVFKADLILVGKETVTIYDYKHGFKPVSASNNKQLITSAHLLYSLFPEYKKKKFYGVIIQPTIKSIESAPIEIKEDYFERLEALTTVKYDSKGNRLPRRLNVGSQCRYCNFAEVCPAFIENYKKFLNVTYLDSTVSRPQAWKEILDIGAPILKALEDIKKTAVEAMKDGIQVPGYTVDKAAGSRRWNHRMNSFSLSKFLGLKQKQVEKNSIVSPAEVEKLINDKYREKFKEIVIQPEYFYAKKLNAGDMFQAKKYKGKKKETHGDVIFEDQKPSKGGKVAKKKVSAKKNKFK